MTRTTGGRLATITYAPGRTVAYEYDGLGHVTRMLDWLGKSITFRYDAAGRMTNILRPNGRGTVLSYDAEDRILQVVHANLGSLTLTRDPEGRIRQAIRDLPLPPPPLQATSTNRYDAAHQEIGSTYDALGRLVASGNRTYRWDLASRLLECTTAGSRFEFTYDAFGQRLSRTSSAGTEHFVWNYDMGLPSLLIQRDGAGTDPWYYLYTPGGQLLQSINAVSGEAYFYHFDEQGNTLWLTDQAGDVAARYLYAPYGELLAAAGDHPNPFRFQGRYGVMHDPTGLSYCRARYLDPDTGRFLSPDPLRGTLPKSANPYPYGLNNPLRYQDPSAFRPSPSNPLGPREPAQPPPSNQPTPRWPANLGNLPTSSPPASVRPPPSSSCRNASGRPKSRPPNKSFAITWPKPNGAGLIPTSRPLSIAASSATRTDCSISGARS